MRVLICDDHKVFAESLALVLADAGHQIVTVIHSLDDALAVLSREPADICLLGLNSAHGAVLDRLADLRAAVPGTAFVLLSGFVDPEVAAVAQAAGVRGFADKEQHAPEILALMEQVAAGHGVVGRMSAQRVVQPLPPRSELRRLAGFLTSRERDVLCGLVQGDDTYQLARSLGVSRATARSYVQSVLTKLGVHSRLEAATVAVRDGLVSAQTGEWLAD